MISLVFAQDFRVCAYVEHRIHAVISPPYVAIGATRDGGETLCGGAIFNRWNGQNMDITIAGAGFMSRATIRAVYRYCFEQVGVRRVTAMTRRSNKAMRGLLPRLGFGKEAEGVLLRYYGPDRADDAFVFALFPEQASKWL